MEESISRPSIHGTAVQANQYEGMPLPGGRIPGIPSDFRTRPVTMRDLLAVLFRHLRLVVLSFSFILAIICLVTFLMPRQYESDMKILVKHERANMVLAPGANVRDLSLSDVTQEDLNSEVELLKSSDLLEKVVITCGLHRLPGGFSLPAGLTRWMPGENDGDSRDMRVPEAVRDLAQNLTVEPISKSHLIDVRYRATDPRRSMFVLRTLAGLYLEKHLSVHRPPGALEFFQQQAKQYRSELEIAEAQLAAFGKKEGIVSLDLEKDNALRALNSLETELQEARAAEASLDKRIKALQTQAAATPLRVTTQVRTSPNSSLVQQLRTTLLTLEMKRTELLTKFEPGYRLVVEADDQITLTREAIRNAETKSLVDETTDLDRTRLWLDEELAKAQAERATLRAKMESLAGSINAGRQNAQQIGRKGIEYQDLVRASKSAEENYLLYSRKEEEARISDALDHKRIVNATIAEAATLPAFPSGPSRFLFLVLGVLLAFAGSIGLAFAADHIDPSLRTADEVEALLGVPVLASLPR